MSPAAPYIMTVCVCGGIVVAANLNRLMRLPPIGYIAVILAGSMALLTVTASVIAMMGVEW
jgi:hypothetical protein